MDANVSASTQTELAAIVFLYRDVLDMPVGWLNALVRISVRASAGGAYTHEAGGAVVCGRIAFVNILAWRRSLGAFR